MQVGAVDPCAQDQLGLLGADRRGRDRPPEQSLDIAINAGRRDLLRLDERRVGVAGSPVLLQLAGCRVEGVEQQVGGDPTRAPLEG